MHIDELKRQQRKIESSMHTLEKELELEQYNERQSLERDSALDILTSDLLKDEQYSSAGDCKDADEIDRNDSPFHIVNDSGVSDRKHLVNVDNLPGENAASDNRLNVVETLNNKLKWLENQIKNVNFGK